MIGGGSNRARPLFLAVCVCDLAPAVSVTQRGMDRD